MPFERSRVIERRLDDVLRMIRTERYSTPMLADMACSTRFAGG
jgi:hypothetical protein